MSEAPKVPRLPADFSSRLDHYVGAHLKLRDKKAEIEKRHKEELAPINAMLEALEYGFLTHLTNTGSDSLSVRGVGTVYKTTKSRASIADPREFRRFVIGGEHWDLVDWKANAVQCRAWINDNSALPPGLNFSEVVDVGVRKG